MKKPKFKTEIDIDKIKNACEQLIEFFDGDDYHEDNIDDAKNWTLSIIMKAVYGDDVYDFINSKII